MTGSATRHESNGALVHGGPGSYRPATALERHAAYFDPERTGWITMKQTTAGIRALGVGGALSWILALVIHVALSRVTGSGRKLDVDIRKIDEGVHEGDTGIFGGDGTFQPAVFEALFEDAVGKDRAKDERALVTQRELFRFMLRDEPFSFGAAFSWAESMLLFCVVHDGRKEEGGRAVPALTKRRLRRFYEGKLLPAIARARRLSARGGQKSRADA